MTRLLAALALVALAASGAAAQSTIRVAVVDNARAAELRGTDIDVVNLGGETAGWRTNLVRAAPAGGLVDVDGRRGTSFRLRRARPIRHPLRRRGMCWLPS